MPAWAVAAIYFGSFIALGIGAKLAASRWMGRKDLDLSPIGAQMGAGGGRRRLFLLGFWRREDGD